MAAVATHHSKAGNLSECLATAEQENDELMFCLMANDASVRKVKLLMLELRVVERKISHLKGEL